MANIEDNYHFYRINNDVYITTYRGKVRVEPNGDHYGKCQLCKLDNNCDFTAQCENPYSKYQNEPRYNPKMFFFCNKCLDFIFEQIAISKRVYFCLGKRNYAFEFACNVNK